MPVNHILLALVVVAVWGCNFIFIQFALSDISPLLLCAVRFFLASIPAIFFIKPPAIPFRVTIIYGLLMFGLQFTLLFMGMHAGMTPGLASLLVQNQVFFSIFFAVLFLGEIPTIWQIIGALISFTGIGLVAIHVNGHVTLAGLTLIIGAAAAWGLGNLVTKKIGKVNMMSLIVWASFVAFTPLLILSLLFEGVDKMIASFQHLNWLVVISVLYIVYASTWVGYGIWNWLIKHHPVAAVVPFALLVPVFGILSSVWVLGEPLESWKIIAGLLVIGGLCVNLLGARFFVRK